MVDLNKEQAPCQGCDKLVDKDDYFCYGCRTVTCDDCGVGWPMGEHTSEAHLDPDIDPFDD